MQYTNKEKNHKICKNMQYKLLNLKSLYDKTNLCLIQFIPIISRTNMQMHNISSPGHYRVKNIHAFIDLDQNVFNDVQCIHAKQTVLNVIYILHRCVFSFY